MGKIISILVLTIRKEIRSFLFFALALVITLIVTTLPQIIKGDGSEVGFVHNILFYTLSIAFGVMASSVLCLACNSISSEKQSKTLQLARVKPLKMWQLWLGKWLGLTAIFALLLLGAIVLLHLRTNSFETAQKAFSHTTPILPSIEEETSVILHNAKKNGASKEELKELSAIVKSQLPFATTSLPRNESTEWNFRTIEPLKSGKVLVMRISFSTDSYYATQPAAICTLTSPISPGKSTSFEITNFSKREHLFPIEGADEFVGATNFILRVTHTGREGTKPIILQPRQGLVLMQETSTLSHNLLKVYIILLSLIALLTAIGLFFSALFSLPVAIFSAVGLIVSVFTASFAASDPDILDFSDSPSTSVMGHFNQKVSTATVKMLHYVSSSAIDVAPIEKLSRFEDISKGDLIASIGTNAILIPFILMVLSSIIMRRKDLPE